MAPEIKGKRTLSPQQEFEMMKLVLDKLLWIGTVIVLYGFYLMAVKMEVADSLLMIAAGAVVFIIFIAMLVRDYEWAKRSK
ncbi:MAG: hypothetical protein QXG86_03335 [Candidatus Woesearchaeota archaeon]